jgi:hypothetical protein
MQKVIKDIEKNASNKIRISLTEFKGYDLIDLRVYYEDEEGDYKPTKKGIALKPEIIPQVIEGLQEAEKEIKTVKKPEKTTTVEGK